LVITALGVEGRLFDVPALVLLAARICQSLTHIAFAQTDRVVAFVFGFYLVQALCMFWMIAAVVIRAW